MTVARAGTAARRLEGTQAGRIHWHVGQGRAARSHFIVKMALSIVAGPGGAAAAAAAAELRLARSFHSPKIAAHRQLYTKLKTTKANIENPSRRRSIWDKWR